MTAFLALALGAAHQICWHTTITKHLLANTLANVRFEPAKRVWVVLCFRQLPIDRSRNFVPLLNGVNKGVVLCEFKEALLYNAKWCCIRAR